MGAVARFLPSLVPGLSALTNPVVLVVLAALTIGSFTTGWKVESWRWDASLKDVAEDNLRRVQEFFDKERKNSELVAAGLNKDRADLQEDQRKFQENFDAARRNGPILKASCPNTQRPSVAPGVGSATTVAESTPGVAAPASDAVGAGVVCDAACMRLWNDGLAQGLPDAYGGWRADAVPGPSDSVEGDALIANGAANGARCNAIRSTLIGWQRKACLAGWWRGAECRALQ